ncbi:two-component regulator propeller domain-containing protein [Duganella radicis]|uniref:diguanylate cyclase n=1 Tax=Duganella radicis TaxID=551988 RepID=A0A6L6PBD0_9BURK|nr:two-component regulator propeller domain-containing protein [Duganella radicis]MTV36123.1 diguanylate cyclase [Duganella radicis]
MPLSVFRACLAICALLLAGVATSAPRWNQLLDTAFQNISQDAGLPGAVVTVLAEDGEGFLWVATQSGLARWDGYRFRVYRAKPDDARSLPDNWVQTLHSDTRGRLWIGTNANGLARYDSATDSFIRYGAGPKGLSNGFVRAIADDGQGGLWIGTDGGLDHLTPDSGAVTHTLHNDSGLPNKSITAIARDRGGALWVGTPAGLVRRAPGATRFEAVTLHASGGVGEYVSSLMEDKQGRVWVGTTEQGAYVVAADTLTATRIVANGAAGVAQRQEAVSVISAAANGDIWLGTNSKGIIIVDPVTLAARRVRHDAAVPSSVADDTITGLLCQRSGLMWVSSNLGLSRHDSGQDAVLTVYGGASRKDGVSDANVTSVLPMPDGSVWLGLATNGVDIIDPLGRRTGALRPGADPATALPGDYVWSMVATRAGEVYLGTQRGLYRVDRGGRGMTRLALSRPKPGARVDALRLDGDTLWVGSWADGLWQLDVSVKGATRVLRHEGALRLTDQRINAIELAADGALWLGTANGLNRYDPASGAVERIVPDTADPQGLGAGAITSLMTDRQGRLWVGTLGGGISILRERDGQGRPRFARLGLREGLPDEGVNKLMLDQDGAVWASTDDGVALIAPETLAVRALRRDDGFQIRTYWGGAGAITAEGEILFGGNGGLTVVRPRKLRPWTFRPRVVITEARVGDLGVMANRYNDPGGATTPLRVTPEANSLAIEFAALDFSAPERNRYAYWLDGYDRDWVDSGPHRRLAAYTNLPPGNYTLRLRGANREGVWSEPELRIPVMVLPAWYQTVWFRLGAGLAALLAVYGVVHTRTAYLRRVQRQLEDKVAERTASLLAATQALEVASLTDPLTGLRNRRFLTLNLDEDIAHVTRQHINGARSGQAPENADLVFFLVDIDHFKQVNDQCGHAAGDAVLMQMRERLQRVFRASDYLIRWGGEEFLVVARATSRAHAATQAERVRASVADEDFTLPGGQKLRKTCSVGFACFPFFPAAPAAVAWPDIVELADLGLYATKRAGRNGWVGCVAGTAAEREGFIARALAQPEAMAERGELQLPSNLDADAVLRAITPTGA